MARHAHHPVSKHKQRVALTFGAVVLGSGTAATMASAAGTTAATVETDLNGDGFTDLVAGTPKTSDGAGSLTVVPGGSGGPVASAKKTLTQASSGVPGTPEAGDAFGAATAWGDVNGDGYADLIVGSPGEDDTAGNVDAGSVTVLHGPALTSGYSFSERMGYAASPGHTTSNTRLGTAVAAGDFDGDGKDEPLAVGTSAGGYYTIRFQPEWTRAGDFIAGDESVSAPAVAVGDFNNDGASDAAISYVRPDGKSALMWIQGAQNRSDIRSWDMAVPGGRSLAAGDINGDGYTDLVVGQPYAESGAHTGGQVSMVPGSATGLNGAAVRTVHQDTSGVPGVGESGDGMGTSVSVGDYNRDGYADVLTGLPGEDITRDGIGRGNAGSSLLLKGTATGLTGTAAQAYNQDTSGISGVTESGDRLGSAVSLTDLNGDGRADLALGADGEDTGNGTILQLDSTSSGISTTSEVYYGRTQLGTQAGARLGGTLTP